MTLLHTFRQLAYPVLYGVVCGFVAMEIWRVGRLSL